MASKNTLELINGNLFTHGGIHPDIANYNITIDEVNEINRDNYYLSWFPKPKQGIEQLITSSRKGICWYRGYFKDDLSQEDVEKGIEKFNAKAVILGHTVQRKIKKLYNGKVLGIDVKHPKDYNKNWPNKKSEGLLITTDGKYYRVFTNGDKKELEIIEKIVIMKSKIYNFLTKPYIVVLTMLIAPVFGFIDRNFVFFFRTNYCLSNFMGKQF